MTRMLSALETISRFENDASRPYYSNLCFSRALDYGVGYKKGIRRLLLNSSSASYLTYMIKAESKAMLLFSKV